VESISEIQSTDANVDDTVAEAVPATEAPASEAPTDFGRSKAIAWYYLGGFGIVHTGGGSTGGTTEQTNQVRIMKWDSAA